MKILHILNSNKFSGAENVVCQIISILRSTEFEAVYCSPDGPIKLSLEQRKVNYLPVKKLTCREVKRVITEYKPDIIHAHDMRASFITSLACGKIPLICHIHNNSFDSRFFDKKTIAFYFAAKKAKHIFWVSQSSFDGYLFKQSFSKKSSILHNIIDPRMIIDRANKDKNQYDFDVVFLGRLTKAKNPMRLIDICSLLKAHRENIKIAIVGSGRMENDVKNKATELSVYSNICFFGFLENPLKILKCSKIMIMTSLWEGLPMCALEAMVLGVPIVSTPVDGLKEIITNDFNGYLSDDNQVLSNKIIEYLENRDKLEFLSNNQVQLSKRWNDTLLYKNTLLRVYLDAKKQG